MNPILPLNEYIPDVEAHVFNDRVYLYGSHDKANSTRFCVQDYVVYSASVNNLNEWQYHGISYRKDQDKRAKPDKLPDYYAPDCVRGNDGRYYLYYVAMGPNIRSFGPISVAVSDNPQGPFEYHGDVRYSDGTVVLKYMNNDPTVLNDEGNIYLYYGWGLGRDFRNPLLKPLYDFVLSKIAMRSLQEVKTTYPSILSCAFCQLEDDMLTVKKAPVAVLDSKTTADKNSELYHHPFYEAPSIRKINGLYYLVYSSAVNNELAYATSKYPDRDFRFRGVIISNSNLGYKGNRIRENNSGTIHGSIECINGKYYVFYHRNTNNTDFSRQVCMEPINIREDGYIEQVEMTTSGIEGSLKVKGSYSAAICCGLITPERIKLGLGKQQKMARITEKEGKVILADLNKGCKVIYRYLDLSDHNTLKIDYQGDAEIKVNGLALNENREVILPKENHYCLILEIVKGQCDIETITFR